MIKNLVIIVISLFLIVFGSVLTLSEGLDYSVKPDFENTALTTMTKTYDYVIDTDTLRVKTRFTHEPTVVYDNSLERGTVKVKITYYDELVKVKDFVTTDRTNGDTVTISTVNIATFESVKKLISLTLNGLRREEIYNYVDAIKPNVTVFMHEEDKDIVKVGK